ncbi:MAG TPA: hypothetical protein PK095_24305, partial [Myxococcota bacterium]|nr:hypothetical protein [Myxococcota bacterium]
STRQPGGPAAPANGGMQSAAQNGLHQSPRGASHAAGEALLRPAENAPPPSPEAAAPLNPRQVLDAWDINRKEGLSVEWISALQGELGVPVTGTSSKELALAVAQRQVAAGQRRQLGELKAQTRSLLVGMFPKLADIPQKPVAANLREGRERGDGRAPENDAVRLLGVAPSYPAYVSSLKAFDFLGHRVVGHPEFLGRLQNAMKYLKGKFPGKSEREIGEQMGIQKTSDFRTSSQAVDNMYHGLGFALDVNPPQNNWLFSHGTRGVKLGDAMKHVGDLFGQAVIRGAADMSKAARAGTTEEAFAALDASNEALKRYRTFKNDPAALEAHLASDKAPAAAKSKGARRWTKTIEDDEKWLEKNLKPNPTQDGPAGFMDFKKELIIALRDAAGLRWGGADLGGDNGDLMHFDGGTMSTAQKLRKKTKDVRAQRAARDATETAQ